MDWGLVPLTNGIQLPWTTRQLSQDFSQRLARINSASSLIGTRNVHLLSFIRVMDDQYLREEWKAQEEESEEIDFDSFDFDDL